MFYVVSGAPRRYNLVVYEVLGAPRRLRGFRGSHGPNPPAATGCLLGLKTAVKPDFQPKGCLRPSKSLQKRPKKPQRQPKRGQERPRDGPRESQEPPADKNTVKITCQKVFRDRCAPDAQSYAGSVAGLGRAAPTGDPATEPMRLTWGRERSDLKEPGNTLPKAQRLPQVNSPKVPSHWLNPPAAGPPACPKVPA